MPDYAKLLQTRKVKEQVGVIFFFLCARAKSYHIVAPKHIYTYVTFFFVLCSNGQKSDVLGQKTFKMFLVVSYALLRLNYNHCP